MPTSMRVVQVGSHTAEISFGGAKVPLGFLASHRKKNHGACQGGGGFLVRSVWKGKTYVVCSCATDRAAKKLQLVKVAGFELLGSEWLVEERKKIALNEERCRREGREAGFSATCPYPDKTDQALAWKEGHKLRVTS